MPRRNPGNRHLRSGTALWGWTLAVSLTLAMLVAAGGLRLARERQAKVERPAGNRTDDAFREAVRMIDRMEMQWEEALDAEADRVLVERNGRPKQGEGVVGVVQRSLLNPAYADPARAHFRDDGAVPVWKPVLAAFGKNEPGEWVFEAGEVLHGSGWIETTGEPPAWWKGNGRQAAVLIVDPAAAAAVVSGHLRGSFGAVGGEEEPGTSVWRGPSGMVARRGPEVSSPPDEILRHVSKFGDWSLERHFPVTVRTVWKVPVLAASLVLSLALAAGGLAVGLWQRRAVRLAEERVSFVNRVSHELRTPLTNLLLNADLALDGLPAEDGRARRRLGLIREETSRLSRIVDNVLAFSRMERDAIRPPGGGRGAGTVLEEIRGMFGPLLERKSIRCEFVDLTGGDAAVDGDALSQILSNLLSNVEKYAGEGASARVSLSEERGRLIAEIEDDGPGIPTSSAERVFRPFERGGSRVDEGASGTGLGLAISRELARGMGGGLELVPSSRGAKFRLEIPLERRAG